MYLSTTQGNSTLLTNPKLTYMYTMNNESDTTSKKQNLHVSLLPRTYKTHANWQGAGWAGKLLLTLQETENLNHRTSVTHDILAWAQTPLQCVRTLFLTSIASSASKKAMS